MESSDAEAAGMVDCGVGTIVWVRRRNGSWWPGKILGPDELSASHLMSPRSGTPVKLLGREDASVDWYNLEKSKRVKPFRCGEFDDCIERAEASQGMPPKKREKYARREDAILHALELEKKLLEKKYGKSGVQTNGLRKDSPASDNGNTQMDEDKRKGPEEQLNIDDKSPEVRPRLRGLQDLAMGGSFNYKLSSMAADSFKHVAADEVLIKTSLEKRKRTQQEGNTSYIEEESLNKRRDRRRPLVQVLKSSVKLAPNIQQLQAVDLHFREEVGNDSYDYTQILSDQVKPVVGLSEENNTTGSNEDTETDSSGTESMMSDTSAALSDEGEEDIEFIPKAFGRSEAALEHESMSEDEEEEDEGEDDDDEDDDDDDLGLPEDSGDSLPLLPQQQTSSGVAVSKWQLKGKRNSRRYAERKVVSSGGAWQKEESVGGGGGIISWEEPCLKGGGGYWEQYQDPHQIQFGGRIKSMLIDVDVGVQSGYQREHVPMISLMSKLNDKAIVGHPIPIETLEDSSSDFILLSATATADDEAIGGAGGDLTLQPWRTARRTAKCRVPRPPHLAEDQYEYPADDLDGKGNRKSKKLLKKVQQQHRKNSASSSNQKIRTLSSIGGSQQQQQQQIPDMERYEEDERVMKPESLPTAVACIPVKLVFSRLHEELVARHQ